MRPIVFVFALLLTGCSSVVEQSSMPGQVLAVDTEVQIYDVAPPNALALGPVTAMTCGSPTEIAKKRLFNSVLKQGGNGVSQLACSDEGMSFYCWSRAKCEAIALNIPPAIIAPPVTKVRKKKPAHGSAPKPASVASKLRVSAGAPLESPAPRTADPKRGVFDDRFVPAAR